MKKDCKVFISVGMSGRSREEIEADIKRAEGWLFDNIFNYERDVVVVTNLNCEPPANAYHRLYCLGEAIKKLGTCDICYFAKGWRNYKGCRIEMEICKEYGIGIIEES